MVELYIMTMKIKHLHDISCLHILLFKYGLHML